MNKKAYEFLTSASLSTARQGGTFARLKHAGSATDLEFALRKEGAVWVQIRNGETYTGADTTIVSAIFWQDLATMKKVLAEAEEKRREIKIRRHEDGTVVFWRYATVSSGSWQSREGKEFLVFRGTNAGYDKLRWADLRDPMEKAGKDRPYDPATPGGLTGTPNLRHIFR